MTTPRGGDVDITYCVTERLDGRSVSVAEAYLSAEEEARRRRFVFEHDRRDFAVAHALLRRTLSLCGDRNPEEWTFVSGPYGKPALAPACRGADALSFNLSHTRGLVACAVTRVADVGLDAECIQRAPDTLSLARRYFSTVEIAELERCSAAEQPVHFTEIWTLKEAFVKAIGEGLSCPLAAFGFTFERAGSLVLHGLARHHPQAVRFALWAPTAGHRMAVAIGRDRAGPIRIRRFDALDGVPAPVEEPPLRRSW